MTPESRAEFKEHCLRRLGKGAIEIEVTEEQVDDRVDEAIAYFWDYHFSANHRTFFKFQVSQNNLSDRVYSCIVSEGGTGYANTDTVVITPDGPGANAAATITTNANGTITDCILSNNGIEYAKDPAVTVSSNTGSGAIITAELGGWVPLPENIIGALEIFPISNSLNTNNLFNIRYQIALNDLYTLTNSSIVPYVQAFQHIQLLEEVLVGKQPMRFVKHRNRAYLDMDWNVVDIGDYLIVDAYQVVDPDVYSSVWKDRWLQRYCTALIKRQWGNHLKKYGPMTLPNGLQMSGQQIYDEAEAEIMKLEDNMLRDYSMPPAFFVG